MKDKLSRIRSPWRRLLITILINTLILFQPRKRRARVHWVGYHPRPRRPERLLFAILLYAAMLVLEPFEYMVWAVVWGSAASFFVIVRSIGMLVTSNRT